MKNMGSLHGEHTDLSPICAQLPVVLNNLGGIYLSPLPGPLECHSMLITANETCIDGLTMGAKGLVPCLARLETVPMPGNR